MLGLLGDWSVPHLWAVSGTHLTLPWEDLHLVTRSGVEVGLSMFAAQDGGF